MPNNTFVSAPIIDKNLILGIMFLPVTPPETRGAKDLLEVVKSTITLMGLDKSNLIGVTTDGKSAKTES